MRSQWEMKGLLAAVALAMLMAGSSCQPDRARVQSPVQPLPSTGACCNVQTGACLILTEQQCSATAQRLFRGEGTVCLPNPCAQPPAGEEYSASSQVGSRSEATIRAHSGAALFVPKYAVPMLTDGSEGKMVFSVERDTAVTAPLPPGVSKISDVYRFGPESFTFGEMVKVTVPYTGSLSGKMAVLYRINQTTGHSEPFGGTVDTVAKTITAMTYKLSPWYAGLSSAPNTAYGAFHITNNSSDRWLKLCVAEYTLKYPEADADFTGDANSAWAPQGEIGWTNSGNWYLPQGTYTFCAQMNLAGTLSHPPGPASRATFGPYELTSPWSHDVPNEYSIPAFGSPVGWEQEECACVPVATVPVGTGQVQVTLTWHSTEHVDLDLWVTDPSGEQCYYGNDSTRSGGRLDRDNACGNYEDGRPENIFWGVAPAGQYKVEVVWFNACSGNPTSMPFEVRVVNGSDVRTFSMTSPADATVEVTRFTVAAGLSRPVSFRHLSSAPRPHGPLPAKGR